jgi:hypothetical protein
MDNATRGRRATSSVGVRSTVPGSRPESGFVLNVPDSVLNQSAAIA